jgi:hypothetical protein
MRNLFILFSMAVALSGCSRNSENKLFLDQNGFVLNAAEAPLVIKVGVGMNAAEFIQKNPALRKVVWVPSVGDVFNELRFSLQAPATLVYDDGVMSFSVCTYSASIDGNEHLKAGVASVGFTACDPVIDDVDAAIRQASVLLSLLTKQAPKIVDLASFYRTAPQEELSKIGGERWERIGVRHFSTIPAPRDNPESMDYLRTLDQARTLFQSKKSEGIAKRTEDGRIAVGSVLVGVFATDKAIVEVGISGADAFGGENLTKEQRNAIRYQVGMNIRARRL